MFILLGLCLVLTGIAGLQFTYTFYVERIFRERLKHIRDLERRCVGLNESLHAAELRITEQDALLSTYYAEREKDEVWADVIEER